MARAGRRRVVEIRRRCLVERNVRSDRALFSHICGRGLERACAAERIPRRTAQLPVRHLDESTAKKKTRAAVPDQEVRSLRYRAAIAPVISAAFAPPAASAARATLCHAGGSKRRCIHPTSASRSTGTRRHRRGSGYPSVVQGGMQIDVGIQAALQARPNLPSDLMAAAAEREQLIVAYRDLAGERQAASAVGSGPCPLRRAGPGIDVGSTSHGASRRQRDPGARRRGRA